MSVKLLSNHVHILEVYRVPMGGSHRISFMYEGEDYFRSLIPSPDYYVCWFHGEAYSVTFEEVERFTDG